MSDTVVLPSSTGGSFSPGDVIADKYRLEHELGRGAMGTVFAAVHVTLGQKVAIKLISAEQAGSNDARLRFSLEAKAAARLKSRHVVQVYDSGHTHDGTPYIVMEYLEGETLEERLTRQHDVGLGDAVRITSHVGRALARAHAQGIIHRDLKSGNIFIAKSDDDELGWVAKVLDFGVAKLTDAHAPSTTKTGTIVGTPLFMSPEQIRGASRVDLRADLYSLGMVFYNMVTGSHAFDGPSYSDVLVAICTEELPPIRKAAPWLPPALSTWFEKACARDREDRFDSADEMIDALQDAAGAAGRLTRPSITDEDEGPGSTMLGHMSPDAAATIQMGDEAPPVSGRSADPALPAGADGGTLRSRSRPGRDLRAAAPDVVIEHVPTPRTRRRHAPLVWWAAAGMTLGILTLLIAALIGRASDTASEPTAAPGVPIETPPGAPAATADSPAIPPVPNAPPQPPPQTAAPRVAAPDEPTAEARPEPVRAAAKAVRHRPREPRPTGATEKQAPPPTPARAAPDMGF